MKKIRKKVLEYKYKRLFKKHGILMGKNFDDCEKIWNRYKLIMGIKS